LSERKETPTATAPADESAILDGLRRRDPVALERAMHLCGDFVARVAARLSDRPEDADDAVQETFLRLWASPPGRLSRAKLSTYLYRVVSNVVSETRRRQARRRESPAEAETLDLRPDDSDGARREAREREEAALALERLIRQLPERQRDCALLHYYEGKPLEEVAEILGCRLGSVKASLFKAREKLRALAEELESAERTPRERRLSRVS
jgi:RNA polymerase sigma-70 factor (ECF subfamily)